ncbi:outer mitochondrial transmembrane helix translocase [Harmonia axyridis]|uniref:outer mitochondrial transmembrane helix translocase n=1 Tax=Harmonia axyridis TaxID=115357 RepID=UPI001E278DB0|nr:outer mitochondrial transmembrane helix translocase [Harmonia axyridis]
MDLSSRKVEIFGIILRLSLVSAVSFLGVKWLMKHLDPTAKNKQNAKEIAEKRLKRIAKNGKSVAIDKLNEYELMIAAQLIHPDDISITWKDIAGLDDVITELREEIILPIMRRDLFEHSILSLPPKGILLYGPPGCGKTLIAKATAKEAGMNFINLDVSCLTDKWYGESQKLAAALFTLADKIQPCIIFIDEIDSFLRDRSTNDHEATAMMKAQFMSWWDGLITDPKSSIIIMGATNRPRDLDRAILRRMPAAFNIGLPRTPQREQVLKLILSKEPKEENIDFHQLAVQTDGFSCSDLMEMCRSAAVYRVKDFLNLEKTKKGDEVFYDTLRPIAMGDLLYAAEKVRSAKMLCGSFHLQTSLDVE